MLTLRSHVILVMSGTHILISTNPGISVLLRYHYAFTLLSLGTILLFGGVQLLLFQVRFPGFVHVED